MGEGGEEGRIGEEMGREGLESGDGRERRI